MRHGDMLSFAEPCVLPSGSDFVPFQFTTMQTHNMFYGDFIVDRQVEERVLPSSEMAEELKVVKASSAPHWKAAQQFTRLCWTVLVGITRSIGRIFGAIRWASEPAKSPPPTGVRPGLGLELVVFGLFVVSAGMSLVL